MATLTERVFRTVGPHFVTLSCVQRQVSTSKERVFVFSGFLVEVDDVWFYVTAGHILRDIRISIQNGDTFDVWRLGDQTAGAKFGYAAIPFHFELDDWLIVEIDYLGLDYAAVPLRDLYRKQLVAGGCVAIGPNAWSDHVTEHDFWALVGIPSESIDYDDKTLITAKVVVIPVTPTKAPEMANDKAQNQFYAKLSADSIDRVTDVDGMSGGPVFALKKIEDKWMYGVIGVQSAWYPSSRVVAVCPFSSFGDALQTIVREGRANASSCG